MAKRKGDTFEYEFSNGKKVNLPPVDQLPYRDFRKLMKAGDDPDAQGEAMMDALDNVASAAALKVIDAQPFQEVVNGLFAAWMSFDDEEDGDQGN